ncbi:MAG: DUF3341 domain-containing protein [Phycisphaerales bacterium]|nr:DUF3341 domain-containing protein [Phycisphaerales bacterium]
MSHASPKTVAVSTEPGALAYYLLEFETPDAIRSAARRVNEAGWTRWDTHTPYPIHGLDATMGVRPTVLPVIVFVCGCLGALTGLALQWWANASDPANFKFIPTFLQGYHFLISGKPYFSLPANIPVIFELTILFSAFGAVFGMLGLNFLPDLYNALFNSRRFARVTDDRFFISLDARDPRFDERKTREFAETLGAAVVEDVRHSPWTAPPQWMVHVGVVASIVALVPLALIARSWTAKSPLPRFHIVQDMDNQERYKAQMENPIFADGRATRLPAEGTVAIGELYEDTHYWYGLVDGKPAETMPERVELNEALMERGRKLFDINCSACHGYDGAAYGAIRVRADAIGNVLAVRSFYERSVMEKSVGHLFNTITNGFQTMPAYGHRVSTEDRWAIVAYVRALQRSRSASVDDLTTEERARLR